MNATDALTMNKGELKEKYEGEMRELIRLGALDDSKKWRRNNADDISGESLHDGIITAAKGLDEILLNLK